MVAVIFAVQIRACRIESCQGALCPISRASSSGRSNTIQCIDSAKLARENHLFGCVRSKPSQGRGPAGLTLVGDFSFCFQCKGASFVLHRSIETTRVTGRVVHPFGF
jgi:hypothetical protein